MLLCPQPRFIPLPFYRTKTTIAKCFQSSSPRDAAFIQRAVELASVSTGFSASHPKFGCVIVSKLGRLAGEGYFYEQGTLPAEVKAVEKAGTLSKGATAYINMEPGDCHGDNKAISALVQSGISRVIVGIKHPLPHFHGHAIDVLRREGLKVAILGEDLQGKDIEEARHSCLLINAPLIYKATFGIPFSVLKFAMTIDGKIATNIGHSAWISSKSSRDYVSELRSRSDAIIIGGNTMRKDDPRLTARCGGLHTPLRVVVTETLDLPEEANLWNTSQAPTIVVTQKGTNKHLQRLLTAKDVEVIEFDVLDPRKVMEYLHNCGCDSALWECGGKLAAAAISSGVINKVIAFVAPKIIGGWNAPTPIGELGLNYMSQAIELVDVSYKQIGPDITVSGFLQSMPEDIIKDNCGSTGRGSDVTSHWRTIFFQKTWDLFGAFSNFSPHPIKIEDGHGVYATWPTVEHYYQAQKFVGVDSPTAEACTKRIKQATCPEEAVAIAKSFQKQHPNLVRADWEAAKISVMYKALKTKFTSCPRLHNLLTSTAGSLLAEASIRDRFWCSGPDMKGLNYLGRLLMILRSELLGEHPAQAFP